MGFSLHCYSQDCSFLPGLSCDELLAETASGPWQILGRLHTFVWCLHKVSFPLLL